MTRELTPEEWARVIKGLEPTLRGLGAMLEQTVVLIQEWIRELDVSLLDAERILEEEAEA